MYLQRHWFTKNRFTNFLSLLLILASLSSQGQAPGLVVNEVSQGSTAAREFAELVVVGPPCTTVDLRGWIIDDNNGEFVDCAGPGNGALSGCGIAGGHIRFKNDPVWSAVPVGTILLVYAFDPGDPGAQAEIGPLTPDYTDQNCDFVRVVPVNASNTFMEMELNLPHSPTPGTACPANRTCPNGSTGDPGYGPATYVPLDNQSFSGFGRLGLRNEGDAFQTRQPNGAFFHGISYGSSDPDCLGAAMPTLNGGPDGTHINDSGSNKTYQFSNTVSDDYRQPLNFISATAASDQSPGRPNNCANAQWIASLRRPPESYFSNGSACQNPTAAPVSICAGQQTTLSLPLNTGPCNSDSYSWMISGSGAVNIIGAVGGTTLTIEGVSAGAMTIVVTATLNHALLAAQGGCAIPPSTATYTFPVTVSNGPPASSTSLTGCAGSNGQAVFDLTSVDQIINLGLGNTVSWFLNGTATNPIPDPTAFSSGTTTVFAQVSDGSGCQSPVVPVPLNVFPAPPAFPAELYGCDQGGGQSTFDLTLANMAVNGGSGLAVDFWLDPAATQAVANPGAFSSPTSVVYATTSAGGCPSAPVPVNLWVTPAPNSANSFIAVDPTVACGPTLVSVQFFFPHPTAAYDLSLLYGNAMSGFQVYNATGVQSGQVAQFNISETTDFQLVGVGLTGNPACDAIFANPITLTVNIADAPILVVNGLLEICAGDAIDLSAFVEETGNPPGAIPITFHSGSPATGGNQIDPVVSPGATTTYYAFADAGGGCTAEIPVTVTVMPAGTPVLGSASLCSNDPPLDLGTLLDPAFPDGTWSGPGVSGDTFDPSGLSGQINLAFTSSEPCIEVANTVVTVNPAGTPVLGSASLCSNDPPLDLSTLLDPAFPDGTWSGPGVSGDTFDPSGLSGQINLAFASSEPCVEVANTVVTVNPAGTPVLGSASLCSNDPPLDLGTLLDPAFPDGTWSGPGVSGDTFDPSGLSGQINLAFTSSEPCIEVANTTVGVSSGPEVINLTTDCAPDNLTYTVSFELIGGDPATYTIDGQPLGGTIFTSGPIEGGTPYSFEIDDDSGCGPQTVSGVLDCFCLSYAGTMDVASGPIVLCSSGNFDVAPFFNNDEFVGPDDALQFVLHSDPGNQLGVVYAVSNSGMFNTSVIPGNQAYASVIVGDDLGGGIDLDDPCLSVAAGIEIWVDELAFMPGPSQTGCEGDCFAWPVSFSGLPPFLVNVIVENGTTVDFGTLVSYTNDTIFHICAADYGLSTGTLTLTPLEMFDAECILIFNVPYTPVDFTWEKPPASDLLMTLCAGESLIVNGTTYDENNPSGTEILTGASSLGCDSILNVQLNFLPAADGQLFVELCDGESITVNGALYDQSNPSGTEIFPNAAANGCDSILQVQLGFLPAADGQLFAGLCNGESITVNGTLYDQSNPSGTEIFPNAAVNGCDSVLQVQLSFLPTASGQLLETLCQGESITVNGTTYDQNNPSGTEILTNAAVNGCDSVLQVQLSFLPTASGQLLETLCQGESITVNGTLYDQSNPSGTEIFPNAAVNGCDSVLQVQLSFLPTASGQLLETLCQGESITVNGTTYDQNNPSGTEIFPNAAVNGCDSVLQVQLSFLPTASGQLLETLCQGESITVNGTTYDQNNPSGTEILTNAAANGCDSILQVQLSFLPAVNGPLIAELLFPGDSIVVNGTVYNQANPSGTEIFAGAAANGCDSIVTISLTFEDIYIGATGISPACFRGEDGLIVIDTLIGGKPPYSVALGSNDFEPIAGFPVALGGLSSGDYDLWIEDADGFTYVLEVTISDPPALVLELGPDRTLPLGESVEFEPLLNFVPAALQWAPSAFLSCDTCLNPLASSLEDITYTLTAIDPLGCLTSDQISLRVYRQRALYAPNAFSPDFDGVNDLFTIFAGAEVAEIRNLQIFNRWGDQVFQAPLIPLNDESWGWDGTFRGQRLDADVFVYYAEVEYIDGQRELIKGDVLLIR